MPHCRFSLVSHRELLCLADRYDRSQRRLFLLKLYFEFIQLKLSSSCDMFFREMADQLLQGPSLFPSADGLLGGFSHSSGKYNAVFVARSTFATLISHHVN